MSEIVLISDTSSDLNTSTIQEFHITGVPFYVSFDGEHYAKEIVEISIEDFYKRMRSEKVFPKTSLPSINDYLEVFKPLVEAGKSVICVCLSSHFSGSYNAACNAKELILENYPHAEIAIINSLNATGGQGLLVTEVGRMIADGLSFTQIIECAEKLREKAKIFFFVDTLDYLEHTGRIGKASALLGTMLNVKPILYLEDGQLFPLAKVRGKKKAIAKIVDATKDYVGESTDDYQYVIAHADCMDDAGQILEAFKKEVTTSIADTFIDIGVTIGVNTGPGAAGICIIPKYETILN